MDILPDWLKSVLAVVILLGGVSSVVFSVQVVLRRLRLRARTDVKSSVDLTGSVSVVHHRMRASSIDEEVEKRLFELLYDYSLKELPSSVKGGVPEFTHFADSAAAVPPREAHEYRVWFGTDRQPVDPQTSPRASRPAAAGRCITDAVTSRCRSPTRSDRSAPRRCTGC